MQISDKPWSAPMQNLVDRPLALWATYWFSPLIFCCFLWGLKQYIEQPIEIQFFTLYRWITLYEENYYAFTGSANIAKPWWDLIVRIVLKNGRGVLAQGTALNVIIFSSYAFECYEMTVWLVLHGLTLFLRYVDIMPSFWTLLCKMEYLKAMGWHE